MKTVLVTGAQGFMGKNLCVALGRQEKIVIVKFCKGQAIEELLELAAQVDLVFHLAGVNRPNDEQEFTIGNAELTSELCKALKAAGRQTPIIFSSSIQAALDNGYGRSKKAAEDAILSYHRQTGAPVYIYRFPNVFGKWSRPDYNSVVGTFCYKISRGLSVQISNRSNEICFAYIDDIVRLFFDIATRSHHEALTISHDFKPSYRMTLGELYDLLVSFREGRKEFLIPDMSNPLVKYLYSTYVSFYEVRDLACPVQLKTDERGWLFELLKSKQTGQIFVSLTRPGVTRGNHYHDTKIEKFCVVQGSGIIRFRQVMEEDVIEYRVNDEGIRVVDIPPGYTHSIENTGLTDMITLFWANEIFDFQRPDTYFENVLGPAK